MANGIQNGKLPDQLSPRYTTDLKKVVETNKGDLAKATATAQTINNFYNDNLKKDFDKVKANAAKGKDGVNVQDEAKLAADIATLQSMEKQFATDANDKDTVSQLTKNPDQTTDNMTTNEILTAAGSTHTKDTDFVYTGMGTQGNQQIDAHVKGDQEQSQGTAAFTTNDQGVTASNSSYGDGGRDWGMSTASGSQRGGVYDPAAGKAIEQKMNAGGSTDSFGPREKATVFARLMELEQSNPQARDQMTKNPAVAKIWDDGKAMGGNIQSVQNTNSKSIGPDAYNAAYRFYEAQKT